jgi:hypothetical protein
VQNRATTELNIGTFVWVSTLFCDLQLPLRLVPELAVAAFGFARLLPKLERTFPYLLFGWLGHDAYSQSRRSRPGQESQKATAGAFLRAAQAANSGSGESFLNLLDPAGAHGEPSKPDNVSAVRVEVPHE